MLAQSLQINVPQKVGMEREAAMDLDMTDIEEVKEADFSRKKYQKSLTLKAGEVFTFGEVKKCRKIFTSVASGSIQFEIRGDYHSDKVFDAGSSGGPLADGGGDFPPKTVWIRVVARADTEFYLHIEWLEGFPITFEA
jgi:hypothetical protein